MIMILNKVRHGYRLFSNRHLNVVGKIFLLLSTILYLIDMIYRAKLLSIIILFMVVISAFTVINSSEIQHPVYGGQDKLDETSDGYTLYGFWPYWIDPSEYSPDWDGVTHVSYFSMPANSDGNLSNDYMYRYDDVKALAESNEKSVTLTVTCFDKDTMDEILAYHKQDLADNILYAIQTYDADGVNIDFEFPRTTNTFTGESNADLFQDLISRVYNNVKGDNPDHHITFCVAGSVETVYRNTELSQYIDAVFLMGYDYHWGSSSQTGPVSPFDYGELDVTDSVVTLKDYYPSTKIIMGIPFYGYDWPCEDDTARSSTTDMGSSILMKDAVDNAEVYGRRWYSDSSTPWYAYETAEGWRQTWYDDEESLSVKWDYVVSEGLAGTGFWALGYEEPSIWDVVKDTFGTRSLAGYKICVDPGHGGDDSGAVGPTGYTEKEANLGIGLWTRDFLLASGADVYMTRESDVTVSLSERVAIANDNAVDIFVSIHNNAYDGTAHGTETYYHDSLPPDSNSAYLAGYLQDELIGHLERFDRGVKQADFYVLRNTDMPASLTEVMFIDNEEEEALLKDPKVRQRAGLAHYHGINHYFGITPAPDVLLSVDGQSNVSQKAASPGVTAQFTYTIDNTGNTADIFEVSMASAPEGWTVNLYDGADEITSFPWDSPILASGDTHNLTLEVNVPQDAQEGDYDTVIESVSVGSHYTSIDNATARVSLEKEVTELNLYAGGSSDGWNFVSHHIVLENSDLLHLLEHPDNGINGSFSRVMWYDSLEERWYSYVPGRSDYFNSPFTWDRTKGIWIKMVVDDVLVIEGTPPTSTYVELNTGWNMMGFPMNHNNTGGLPYEVDKVGYFDVSQPYNIAYDFDPLNFTFNPGCGYWIHNPTEEILVWSFIPESQDNSSEEVGVMLEVKDDIQRAQRFVLSCSVLSRLELPINSNVSTAEAHISIRSDDGGSPSVPIGEPIWDTTVTLTETIGPTWVSIDVGEIDLVSGETYWICINWDGSNIISWYGTSNRDSDPAYSSDGDTWYTSSWDGTYGYRTFTLDETSEEMDDHWDTLSFDANIGNWSVTHRAQKFVPTRSLLTRIELPINIDPDHTGPTTVEISIRKDDVGEPGKPYGNPLAVVEVEIDHNDGPTWVNIDFGEVYVVSGETYWICVGRGGEEWLRWWGSSDLDTDTAYSTDGGDTWSTSSTDMTFGFRSFTRY